MTAPKALRITENELAQRIRDQLLTTLGKEPQRAKPSDFMQAAIMALRGEITEMWLADADKAYSTRRKRVYYLSMEFLIGRLLRDTLHNLSLTESMRNALRTLGAEFDIVAELESDAALGNGGLGRLAACFMESMATLDIPAHGYGIRYRHGLFKQSIVGGQQAEAPELWVENGNPWEIARSSRAFDIGFGGSTQQGQGALMPAKWTPAETLSAVAHDMPIAGWNGKRINTLRLWHAKATQTLDLNAFNAGDHVGAQHAAARAEAINRVLYPSDSSPAGHELRLRQQFFFVSASLQDILRRHLSQFSSLENLSEQVAIQLNDTHPSIAIAELMRLLVDEHHMDWVKAWALTRATCSYTNHTLLPEALETWPVGLMEHLLPRHMQIIYLINTGVLQEAQAIPNLNPAAVSLIDEHNGKRVRMGQLAFAGSHSINGVSALHSDLMKQTVFKDLNTLYPKRINNKTNGVTPRRWFHEINPELSRLVENAIGPAFLDDHARISDLKRFAKDAVFHEKYAKLRLTNKQHLAKLVKDRCSVAIDPAAMFDVQIKRIHEYKRQQLAIIETVALYLAIKANPNGNWVPRVKLFAGKAAPSYWAAKTVIRLINDVGSVVNNDPQVKDLLKVVFVPNYNVTLAEVIVPAADLSEQISTAGMEASGTGNMKLAMNGALTIGTMDGANIEISENVGVDNMFIFGLTAAEVAARRTKGHHPSDVIQHSPHLKSALDAIAHGVFSAGEPSRYQGFVENLYNSDFFMVTPDFAPYSEALNKADVLWRTPAKWLEKSITTVASMGWFSSDRTIREYAKDIWQVETA
jgi:glycogen phosphorylase